MRSSILILATFAGFLGGLAGSRITTAFAQSPSTEVIQSRSFVLLDSAGRKRGEWMIDVSGQAVIRLFDSHGQELWDTAGTAHAQRLVR
jgi:hypothetical protein